VRFPCPFGNGECTATLTVTLAGRYFRATASEPAEGPDLTATGCHHVTDASGWEWNRPGGIADRLWALVEEMDLDAWDAEIDRRIHAAREG